MGLRSWLTGQDIQPAEQPQALTRSGYPLTVDSWLEQLNYAGVNYQVPTSYGREKAEEISKTFAGYALGAYASSPIVFTAMMTRMLLFSEARFQWLQFRDGRPGNLFGTQALQPLEEPWEGGQTAELLTRMIQDVDLDGNAFVRRVDGGLERLRPDWVTIIHWLYGDPGLGARISPRPAGYLYLPGGPGQGNDPVGLPPSEVAHWAPLPDPLSMSLGMSWVTPILRDIQSDRSSTTYGLRYFESGGANFAVTVGQEMDPDNFKRWVELFRQGYSGPENAGKIPVFTVGSNITPISPAQLSVRENQTGWATRICAAAGIPAEFMGLPVEGSSAGSYDDARRRVSLTMRALWRSAAQALDNIIGPTPPASKLWYDDRDIPQLQESRQDAVNIQATQVASIVSLYQAGFTPESATNAVISEDLRQLEHTGVPSVQVQQAASMNGESSNGGATLPANDEVTE